MQAADRDTIRAQIKDIISNVTSIPVERIGDDASFATDLELDSLAMLEIGVDVDYAFRLGIEDLDERLGELRTLEHVVDLVATMLTERPD